MLKRTTSTRYITSWQQLHQEESDCNPDPPFLRATTDKWRAWKDQQGVRRRDLGNEMGLHTRCRLWVRDFISTPEPHKNWLWDGRVQHVPGATGTVAISIVWVRRCKPDRTTHRQRVSSIQLQRGLGHLEPCRTELVPGPAMWCIEQSSTKRKKEKWFVSWFNDFLFQI